MTHYYFSYDKSDDVLWAFSDSEIRGKLHKYSNNNDIWVRDDRGTVTCMSALRWSEHAKRDLDVFLALIAGGLDMKMGVLFDRLKLLRLIPDDTNQ